MFDSKDYISIIAQADENHDGKISYDEFVKFVCKELDEAEQYFI